EAAQVDVQLAVREPVGDSVRPVHGQGGLADARGPVYRCDHYRTAGRSGCVHTVDVHTVDQVGQGLQLIDTAGEVAYPRRQLPGHHATVCEWLATPTDCQDLLPQDA